MLLLSRERHHQSAGRLQRKLVSDSEETLKGREYIHLFYHYKTLERMENVIQKARSYNSPSRFSLAENQQRVLILPFSKGLDFAALSRLKKRLPGCKLDPDEGDSSFNLNCPSFDTFC